MPDKPVFKVQSVDHSVASTDPLQDPRVFKEALDKHAIVSIADASGNITYANDKFCEISKYSRDELIGQNHRLVKSGTHDVKFFDDMWLTISSGRTWHGEICNRNKDGGLYWVETTIVPSLDKNGVPYQYVSIRTEITWIVQAKIALAQSAEELERRVNEGAAGLWPKMELRSESEQLYRQLSDNTLKQITQRFSTEESAREYLEHLRWPEGPVCPHCGNADQKRIYKVAANPEKKIRAGLYKCAECEDQFTVTVGTVCESSHTPLNKWLMALYIMCASKTKISAYQLKRRLGLGSHATASFILHRIHFALQNVETAGKLE